MCCIRNPDKSECNLLAKRTAWAHIVRQVFNDMKTGRVLLSIGLMAVLLGGIILVLPLEPRYHGRSLTSWLEQCADTPLMETQRLTEAQEAVCAMPGREVVPRLLALVQSKDDPVSRWIISQSGKLRLDFLTWRSDEDLQQLGIAGFEALGTNAVSAVGALTRLLDGQDCAFAATRCLVFLGPEAEEPMCKALTNENRMVRQFAASQLSWVCEDAGSYVRHLTNCLADPDEGVRFAAIQGIGAQTQLPEMVIPILIATMEKHSGNVSTEAAHALAGFGTNALDAMPALRRMASTRDFDSIAKCALRTLVAISPDQALPMVLSNWNSSDDLRRQVALQLLCQYPRSNPEIAAAIESAAGDANPKIARYAQTRLTKKYQQEHQSEPLFPGEPNYAGKSLSEWLASYDNALGDYPQSSREAFRIMGTNAIPALMARLVYVQPPFGLAAYDINVSAVKGFIELGDAAIPALPRLASLMDSTNEHTALFAMMSACGTGSNAIPFLIKGLTNQHDNVRSEAINDLTSDLGRRYPNLRRPAVPLLTDLLTNPQYRESAGNALKDIDPQTAARAGVP
jgi:HEAT repeat protein